MKQLVCIILIMFLTSACGSIRIGGNNWEQTEISTGGETASILFPHEVYVKWKIKKKKWSYEAWDYIDEERCGWRYDGWMNQLGIKDSGICTYVCETRAKTEFRNDLFISYERCLYFDYKGTL